MTTNDFAIGTLQGAVSGLSVSVSPNTVGASPALYTVEFNTPIALMQAGSTTNTLTISDSAGNAIINSNTALPPTAPTCPGAFVAVADLTAGSNYGVQCETAQSLSAGTITLPGVPGTNTISAGDRIALTFNASNPTTAGTYSFTVSLASNSNGTTVSTQPASASFTITGTTAPGMSITASSVGFGQNATYTINNVPVAGAAGGSASYLNLIAEAATGETLTPTTATEPTPNLVLWSPSTSYTISDKTAGGTTTNITATSVANNYVTGAPCPAITGANNAACSVVTLALSQTIANGDTLTITGSGTNPTANPTTDYFAVQPVSNAGACTGTINTGVECFNSGAPTSGYPSGTPGTTTPGTAQGTSGNLSIAYGTSVSNITVTPSPATQNQASTYTITFKATTAIPPGGSITLTETAGPTNFGTVNGYIVADDTQGTYEAAQNLNGLPNPIPLTGLPTLSSGNVVNAGDQITVTLTNVTNPGQQTITDFNVSTSADTVPAAAAAYTIGPTTGGINVVVTPNTTGSIATYTISNFKATASLAGGTDTLEVSTFQPGAPNNICPTCVGLVFPNTPADYTITDTTTPSGSGTVAQIVSGGGTNDVVLRIPNNINSGDVLTLTITNVINPSSASTTDYLYITGNYNAITVGVPTFPDANVTFPNGAIIRFGTTDYVMAGGHAFGIATPVILAKIQTVDKAAIVTAPTNASPPTSVLPRPGTLITTNAVNGNGTIYVVGTDGQLHGFATPAQYLGDGFDPALNVTVPTINGMTVGTTAGAEGTGLSALTTAADGAIVDSSGTYYVFQGGRAFGIPTPTWLATVRAADKATPLSGSVTSTQTGAAIANGALVTIKGIVYVAYGGSLYSFVSWSELASDGYAGTASVTVPSASGLTVNARPYVGS
jgi:hypothetical protein